MIITVAAAKGGVGKTTTALFLARQLARRAGVVVLDADPQASATEWALTAKDTGDPLPFEVRPTNQRALRQAGDVAEHVVIDTPPGHPEVIHAAIEQADVVVIPTEASGLDMLQMWQTLEACHDTPAAVLLTKARLRTKSHQSALDVLASEDVAVIEQPVLLREAIKNSFGTSIPKTYMYEQVLDELNAALDQGENS